MSTLEKNNTNTQDTQVKALQLKIDKLQKKNNKYKKKNLLLKKGRQLSNNIFEHMSEGYCCCEVICNKKGIAYDFKILEVNPAFAKQSGIEVEGFVGKTILEYYPDIETSWVKKLAKVGMTQKPTTFIKYNHNTKRYYETSAYAPELGKFVILIRDVTKRQKEESKWSKALQKAEENDRLKSAFLANMSHEIRTPMNGILGFTRLLKEPQLSGEERLNYINIIDKSGDRLLNIINDIISISKIESGEHQINRAETKINQQTKFIYDFFKQEITTKGLDFICQNPKNSDGVIINSDSEKIYAILTNLVKNAIKFTESGSIEFGYNVKDDFIHFFVKDTGSGMDPEQSKIVFERFRQGSESLTRNYEGAGLGLSISKAYVQMLGGKIWVESEVNKGSNFYFTIPKHTVPVQQKNEQNTIDNDILLSKKNLKILIAEDDEISKLLITYEMKVFSQNILNVSNGEDAVIACRNNPDIDLILMDVKMPFMDGYEATREIRKFNKDVIIITQTAFVMDDEKTKALEAGCSDYIAKPIKRDLLGELIAKHL